MKIIIFFILIFSYSLVICQEDSLRNQLKNEIGGNLFRWSNLKFKNIHINLSYLNGISYKKRFSSCTYRSSGNYIYTDFHNNSKQPDYIFEEYLARELLLSTGLEKNIYRNKFNYYYGIDLLFSYIESKSDISGGIASIELEITYKGTGFGIAPLIGCSYNFSKRFSFTIEENISIIRFNGLIHEWYTKPNPSDKSYYQTVISYIYNPISSVSLNYRF